MHGTDLWQWGSDEKVQLFMGKPQQGGPLIRLICRVPRPDDTGSVG